MYVYIYMGINIFSYVCKKKNVLNTLYFLDHEDKLFPSSTNDCCLDISQWTFNEEEPLMWEMPSLYQVLQSAFPVVALFATKAVF